MDHPENDEPDPEMLEEYDFSEGVRGKYANRFTEGMLSATGKAFAFRLRENN